MDFGSLLHVAKKNEYSVKKVKCYKSTFEPPKKEQKSKSLSANIQKFLARKEEEEKIKVHAAKKKKDELLALRSQDGKAKKRVAAMLNRTKAANKSAIADAVDNENTAVTLGGLAQPDEDDYGYVSQEATAFYTKLMEKYTSTPSDEPKFSKKSLLKSSVADLNNTKDRVRMALLKEEEEEMMPHKRKRKTKEEKLKEPEGADKSHSQSDYREDEEDKPEKSVKSRRPAPPPMDFHALLKIAEKKQFEPIKIEPKVKEEDELERPMTKKQRAEYLKEKEWRMRKEGKLPPLTASKQDSRNSRPQPSEERSRDQKSSRPAPDSSRDQRNNRPSVDGNGNQRSSLPPADRQREQMNSRPSGYSNKDQMSGRLSDGNKDQRNGRPSGDVSRDQRNSQPLEGSRDQKNNRSSENGNSSIPRIPKVNNSSRVEKDERSQHRILNNGSSSDRSVRLQGNSDSKVCKDRSRDEGKNSNVAGKLSVKNNHTPSSSASGQGSANRNSVEQRRDISSNSNISSSKNYNLSGYSKKLQESLLAKLQEKERSGRSSEANKFRVPEAPTSKFPKSRDSASFDMNRGLKSQSKLARSSDSKEAMRKESPLGKNPSKPLLSSQRMNESPRGTLPSKSQESALKNKFGHGIPAKDKKPAQIPSRDVKSRQLPSPDVKPRQFPPPDIKPRQFPPPDVKPRQFPPSDVRTRQFPPADVRRKPKPPVKRRIEDSDEEYDSELDDFIDDGPDETEDYSKHIKEIFGYDKSRYRDLDDGGECMESSFSQQLREEFVSSKMGMMEDLEDMEMEKRELARKKKLMVMNKKRKL